MKSSYQESKNKLERQKKKDFNKIQKKKKSEFNLIYIKSALHV